MKRTTIQLGTALCLLCSGWGIRSASAVVVSGPLSSATTTRPADDPGWSNLGLLKGSTAVYLGDRWVLTAAHVGTGSVTFPALGKTFAADSSTAFRPLNPTDRRMTTEGDLLMFRLLEEPKLPPISISHASPPLGSPVWVAGNGKDRDPNLTHWSVNMGSAIWTWSETTGSSDYSGYKTLNTNSLRWGTNLIEQDELARRENDADIRLQLETVMGDTLVLVTEFDQDGSNSNSEVTGLDGRAQTEFESQAVLNDSGGVMFHKRPDGHWELAGTVVAVEGIRNQPDVVKTPIFGNFTFYADLASYLEQIQTRTVYGDFNGDLELTAADIDLLSGAIGSSTNLAFDLDRDGRVARGDHRTWVDVAANTYLGDANLDGEFDSSDLILVLQGGLYESEETGQATWDSGDWNADRDFNSTDLIAALQSGGYELGPRALPASDPGREPSLRGVASVPEPSSLALLLGSLACLLQRARSGRPTSPVRHDG